MPLITSTEYPSLSSGTSTPTEKLCLRRSDRAKKLGRYSNFFAAAITRSRVSCGIDRTPGALFRTSEIVAGDKSR